MLMASPKILAFWILRVLMKMAGFSADSAKDDFLFLFFFKSCLLPDSLCFELILYDLKKMPTQQSNSAKDIEAVEGAQCIWIRASSVTLHQVRKPWLKEGLVIPDGGWPWGERGRCLGNSSFQTIRRLENPQNVKLINMLMLIPSLKC